MLKDISVLGIMYTLFPAYLGYYNERGILDGHPGYKHIAGISIAETSVGAMLLGMEFMSDHPELLAIPLGVRSLEYGAGKILGIVKKNI